MKRKIALLLAVAMIISLWPINLSAARLGGGPLPAAPYGDITVNTGSPLLRAITFSANDFPVAANNIGFYQAIITLDGLGDGSLLPFTGLVDGIGAGSVPTASRAAIEALPMSGSAWGEVLSAGSAVLDINDTYMVVIMTRDGTRDNRAILHIMVAGSVIPAGFGVNVPIAYEATGNSNVTARFVWQAGIGWMPSVVTLLQRSEPIRPTPGRPSISSRPSPSFRTRSDNISDQWFIGPSTTPADTETPATDADTLTVTHPAEQPIVLRLAIGDPTPVINGIAQPPLEAAPFIDPVYNRTMVPLRVIAEALGASVSWIAETRTVTISQNGVILSLTVDEPLPNDMGRPMIVNDRIFVPIAYIAQMLGTDIRWDEDTRAVYITP